MPFYPRCPKCSSTDVEFYRDSFATGPDADQKNRTFHCRTCGKVVYGGAAIDAFVQPQHEAWLQANTGKPVIKAPTPKPLPKVVPPAPKPTPQPVLPEPAPLQQTGTTVCCAYCGKPINRKRKASRPNQTQFFCSQEHSVLFRQKNSAQPKRINKSKETLVELTCTYCKQPFMRKRKNIHRTLSGEVFCCREHQQKHFVQTGGPAKMAKLRNTPKVG